MGDERRRAERHETSRIGRISGQGLSDPIECIVSDVSKTGALLVLKGEVRVPNTFMLRITGIARSFECEVRRRGPQTLGVHFTSQTDLRSA